MRDDTGYDMVDDDDFDAVLVEDETGAEERVPQHVVFELALSDAGPAVDLAREATSLGYEVEVVRPDDGEGWYVVTCSREMAAAPAEIARARRELEALAEEFGCLADDDEHGEGDAA